MSCFLKSWVGSRVPQICSFSFKTTPSLASVAGSLCSCCSSNSTLRNIDLDSNKLTPKGFFWLQIYNPLVTTIDVSQKPFVCDANDAIKMIAALWYRCCRHLRPFNSVFIFLPLVSARARICSARTRLTALKMTNVQMTVSVTQQIVDFLNTVICLLFLVILMFWF
jgi:hypothetical protein